MNHPNPRFCILVHGSRRSQHFACMTHAMRPHAYTHEGNTIEHVGLIRNSAFGIASIVVGSSRFYHVASERLSESYVYSQLNDRIRDDPKHTPNARNACVRVCHSLASLDTPATSMSVTIVSLT